MSLRSRVPHALHGIVEDAYVRVGQITAGARLAPNFLMIGASRAGTTSLFRALTAHPQILRPPVNKGVRYFDLNYVRNLDWYLGHFPLRAAAARTSSGDAPKVTFEASGYYLFHPFAPERVGKDLPGVKIVAMLRDPVERAFSAWKHESARGFEWEPFERALDLEDERLLGEVERMARHVDYRSFCHWHHSHRGRGEYAPQLDRWLTQVPSDRLHLIPSESFFEHPEREYRALLDFLELPAFVPASFDRHNARPSSGMPDSVRRALADHYAPLNARVERLVGRQLAWT